MQTVCATPPERAGSGGGTAPSWAGEVAGTAVQQHGTQGCGTETVEKNTRTCKLNMWGLLHTCTCIYMHFDKSCGAKKLFLHAVSPLQASDAPNSCGVISTWTCHMHRLKYGQLPCVHYTVYVHVVPVIYKLTSTMYMYLNDGTKPAGIADVLQANRVVPLPLSLVWVEGIYRDTS